jgi:CheY-like chemotaxis protein
MATAIFMIRNALTIPAGECFRSGWRVDRMPLGIQQLSAVPQDTTSGRPFRVLVVDDDPGIRRMIVAALKRDATYEFFEAPNGRDALDIMRGEQPDVVVLYLMMPILSGWDVLRERQTDPVLRRIPVIIVSANRDPEIAHVVDKGICAFLPKPFDIGALSALVKTCLVPGR